MESMLEKLWGFVMVAVGSLLSYFIYSVKTSQKQVQKIDDQQCKIKVDNAVNKTLLIELKEDVHELKENVKTELHDIKRMLVNLNGKKK